jgi:hypothetical protein
MFKKLCVTGFVVAAAGATLMAVPAHADDNSNSSWNGHSLQSGNNFSNVVVGNHANGLSTNVNNINGNAVTAANGSGAGIGVSAP